MPEGAFVRRLARASLVLVTEVPPPPTRTFQIRRAANLETRPSERRWLVDQLWGDEAVGLLGGEPKSYKSWLALELAVAVASGKPCMGKFEPQRTGPVLLIMGEDAAHVVRERLRRIAARAQVALDDLPLEVVLEPSIQLNLEADMARLGDTVAAVKPALMVLDPFVRLHRIDEKSTSGVVPILSGLRALQRLHHTAVLVVHHVRKGSSNERGGQALRGSSELHAWGDSNLYVRWRENDLVLNVEHRGAAAPPDMVLELKEDGDALGLAVARLWSADGDEVSDSSTPRSTSEGASPRPRGRKKVDVTALVEATLRAAARPLQQREIRELCGIRMTRVGEALAALIESHQVHRDELGYVLVNCSTVETSTSPTPAEAIASPPSAEAGERALDATGE